MATVKEVRMAKNEQFDENAKPEAEFAEGHEAREEIEWNPRG